MQPSRLTTQLFAFCKDARDEDTILLTPVVRGICPAQQHAGRRHRTKKNVIAGIVFFVWLGFALQVCSLRQCQQECATSDYRRLAEHSAETLGHACLSVSDMLLMTTTCGRILYGSTHLQRCSSLYPHRLFPGFKISIVTKVMAQQLGPENPTPKDSVSSLSP